MPRVQLVAFERVFIKSQQYVDISTAILPQSMAVWRDGVGFIIEQGTTAVTVILWYSGYSKYFNTLVLRYVRVVSL